MLHGLNGADPDIAQTVGANNLLGPLGDGSSYFDNGDGTYTYTPAGGPPQVIAFPRLGYEPSAIYPSGCGVNFNLAETLAPGASAVDQGGRSYVNNGDGTYTVTDNTGPRVFHYPAGQVPSALSTSVIPNSSAIPGVNAIATPGGIATLLPGVSGGSGISPVMLGAAMLAMILVLK